MIPSEARGAWNEIEVRLRPYVARRVASGADVDDIIQEIFLRMHRGVSGLRDDERFGGWLYRIAEHVIVDFGRARTRGPVLRADLADPPDANGSESAAEELQEALGQCVALFVARLPSPYREAITLTELQGLTQKDAADLLGVSLSAMKSRVQRAREKIRDLFDECCRISVDSRGRVVECEPRRAAKTADSTNTPWSTPASACEPRAPRPSPPPSGAGRAAAPAPAGSGVARAAPPRDR